MGILSVIVAAAAGFAYGAVHYMTLARPWMRAAGIPTDTEGRPAGGQRSPVPFVLSAIAMLFVAGFMRHIFAMSGIDSPGKALLSGLGVGLFFITPLDHDQQRLSRPALRADGDRRRLCHHRLRADRAGAGAVLTR